MWSDGRQSDQIEEEEDMKKRENELKQELNMATLRCEELKRTLIETKSFIDPIYLGSMRKEGGTERRGSGGRPVETMIPVGDDEEEDEEEDDDDEDDDEEEETYDYSEKDSVDNCPPVKGKPSIPSQNNHNKQNDARQNDHRNDPPR
jgi:hypothetical protein